MRTAEELGVVSPVTKTEEMFCGKHPPQVGSQSVKRQVPISHGFIEQWDTYTDQPMCLPPCNDGQGYRNMSCWSAKDENTRELFFDVKELGILYELMSSAPIEWKLHNADLYDRCRVALIELRSKG